MAGNIDFDGWLDLHPPTAGAVRDAHVRVLSDEEHGSDQVVPELSRALLDHLIGHARVDRLKRLKGAEFLVKELNAKFPTSLRMKSGDLGETVAAEFIASELKYIVPIGKLRHKTDREDATKGDDLLAYKRRGGRVEVLKCEFKSRQKVWPHVVEKALEQLNADSGHPRPSSLSFISSRLEDLQRMEESDLFAFMLEKKWTARNLSHLLFTFSGNDPTAAFAGQGNSSADGFPRQFIGVFVSDHKGIIIKSYEGAYNEIAG